MKTRRGRRVRLAAARRSPRPRRPGCSCSRPAGWSTAGCGRPRSASTWSACWPGPGRGPVDHVRGVGLMGFATARTISLQRRHRPPHRRPGRRLAGPGGHRMVGRPDASISEARDRCRAALTNSRYAWPVTRRITILLSPADLPKRGPHFDLAIAVGVLAAAGRPPGRRRGGPPAATGAAMLDGLRVHRRADPRRPAPLRARRAADDDGRPGPGPHPRRGARAAGRGGRDGARA